MSIFSKLILLAVGLWPFIILLGNVRRRVSFSFVAAATISTLLGAALLYLSDGVGRHPHVSALFLVLFLLWPVALMIAKNLQPSLPWTRLWLSVPIMSWFTITLGVATNYPTHGAGGGLGMIITLALGWLYMLPLFGLFQLFHILLRYTRNRFSIATTKRCGE